MKYFFYSLLLFSQFALGEVGFTIEDCNKLLSASGRVSYPKIVTKIDKIALNSPLSVNLSTDFNFEGLKYRKQGNYVSRVNFAKIKASDINKSNLKLAEYLGVTLAKVPHGYWDSIVYFIQGIERITSLKCDSLDERGKIDVIVLSSMSQEILPFKDHDAVMLAYNFDKGYYYLVSQYPDSSFSIELKINLHGYVYTVVVYGDDRKNLELFVVNIIELNKG